MTMSGGVDCVGFELDEKYSILYASDWKKSEEKRVSCVGDIQLYDYQQDILDNTRGFNRVAYYLDMGLGKTFIGSEKMHKLGTKINLLICQKTKIDDWLEHFRKYKVTIRNLTDKTHFDDFMLCNKLFNEHPTEHRGILYIGIINYDLVFRRPQLKELRNYTLMLDESSKIQNETNKRSKFVLKMMPDNVILLSGTPTAGKYEKLWSQVRLLGWNISKDLYWKQYIETEWVEEDSGFFRKDVVGYKNVDRLKRKLAQHGAVFLKSDEVVDLPDQVFTKIKVPTTKEYRKFMKSRIVKIDGRELVGDNTLTKRLYARMICGQFNQKKLDAFKDLVDSTDDRVVVFYNFSDELTAMLSLVDDRPVSIINGSTKDLTAYEDDGDSITFIQYQAGAMGLNLQKANKVIYFTLPESSELYEQSKKRVHRIGQDKRCFYYLMMCKDSVEEDILQNLEMRKDYTDELFKAYDEG